MLSALSDNSVWLDGLVIFYPIFKYLETNVSTSILPVEYHRAAAFEADIKFYCEYLGLDWTQVCAEPRKSVSDYLKHLEKLKNTNPTLLTAYVYHLYMGLLSGGQILQKKRQIFNKFNPLSLGQIDGYTVTHFGDDTIVHLKSKMRAIFDEAGKDMDEETKRNMIEESKRVFILNNEIVNSVKGVRSAALKKLGITAVVILSLWFCYQLVRKQL